ncbi:oligosaccharide flippase family protein [Virgibacillus sp. FSP13]
MAVKRLSLKMNMSWTLAGSVIYSFTQWLLLIIIAKLGNPEMVGLFALGLAVTAPIIMLTDMELRMALVTDAKSSFGFAHYAGTRILSVGLSFAIMIVAVLVLGYGVNAAIIIILIGMTKLPESVSDIYHGLLQKHERMDLITISNSSKGILTVLVFAVMLYVTNNLMMAIMGQLMVWTLILLFLDCKLAKQYAAIQPLFHPPSIRKLVQLTIPLGFMALLTSFNTNIPSYLVEYYLGKEELGYFAAILYIYFAGSRMSNSLRQPTAPMLATLYADNNIKGYLKLLSMLMALGLLIGFTGFLVVSLFGKFLLSIIYTPGYAVYSKLFIVIMVSGIISYPASFLDTGIMATRFFRFQPYLAGVRVVASLIGCFLFIPEYGLLGAAYALIFSSAAKLFGLIFVLVFILKRNIHAANMEGGERISGF